MDKKDKDFLKKAEELIKKYQNDFGVNDFGYFDYKDPKAELYNDLKMDMIHLIYSYDPEIPVFGKIKKTAECGGMLNMHDVIKCLEYVIHYINDIKLTEALS